MVRGLADKPDELREFIVGAAKFGATFKPDPSLKGYYDELEKRFFETEDAMRKGVWPVL